MNSLITAVLELVATLARSVVVSDSCWLRKSGPREVLQVTHTHIIHHTGGGGFSNMIRLCREEFPA